MMELSSDSQDQQFSSGFLIFPPCGGYVPNGHFTCGRYMYNVQFFSCGFYVSVFLSKRLYCFSAKEAQRFNAE